MGKLGVNRHDRVATLAWNGFRHLEVYYAAPGMGAVCHPINPRLQGDITGLYRPGGPPAPGVVGK
jgi:fatty-acyl-CoA synthase